MRANRGIARGLRIHGRHVVGAARGALHGAAGSTVDLARAATAQVRSQRADVRFHAVRAVLAVFQRPLLDRTVDQAQVVDARIFAGCFTSLDEVRDRNRGQETDDCHHDHDFDEREARFT